MVVWLAWLAWLSMANYRGVRVRTFSDLGHPHPQKLFRRRRGCLLSIQGGTFCPPCAKKTPGHRRGRVSIRGQTKEVKKNLKSTRWRQTKEETSHRADPTATDRRSLSAIEGSNVLTKHIIHQVLKKSRTFRNFLKNYYHFLGYG